MINDRHVHPPRYRRVRAVALHPALKATKDNRETDAAVCAFPDAAVTAWGGGGRYCQTDAGFLLLLLTSASVRVMRALNLTRSAAALRPLWSLLGTYGDAALYHRCS
jgi:hypothetical protein